MNGVRLRGALLLPALLLFLAACDSADPISPTEVTVQGKVTTSDSYAEEPSAEEPAENATVRAAAVSGTELQWFDATATTDAQGEFTLTIDNRPEPILIQAETEDGMRVATVIEANAGESSANLTVPPLNVQSTAASDIFLAARGDYPSTTTADVMLHVTPAVAMIIGEGEVETSDAGRAIGAAVTAETVFASGAGESAISSAVVNARRAAYADLRHELAAAGSASARMAALDNFFEAYTRAYIEAGASALVAARAAATAARAATHFSGDLSASHEFDLTHQAQLAAAKSAALAVEAEFEAAGASAATMQALTIAHNEMMTALKAATSAAAMADAMAAYSAQVQAELAAELDVPESTVSAAIQSTAAAQATLDSAISVAGTAGAIADAYAAYYEAAYAAAESALGVEGSFGANVVTTIAMF